MRETIRQAVTTAIQGPYDSAFPNAPVVFQNAPFDWNNPPALFTEMEIEYLGGRQIGAAAEPKTRLYGYVYASVKARDGTGSAQCNLILNWIASALEYKKLGPAQFQASEDDGSTTSKGWYQKHIKVSFYADP